MRREVGILVLAACHQGGPNVSDDAGVADVAVGALDAMTVDADEATRVEVSVTGWIGDGAPDPDAIVVFSDHNGVVVQAGTVDATGHAHAYLPAGGEVTVLQANSDPTDLFRRWDRLTTFRGVKPLDQLVAGGLRDPNRHVGDPDVMYGAYPVLGGAAGFLLPCASSGSYDNPRPLQLWPQCQPALFDVLAVADDTSGVRHYSWKEDIANVMNGTFTMPAWTEMPKTTVSFSHVPANLTRVGAFSYAAVDGYSIELDRAAVELPPSSTSVSLLYAPNTAPSQITAQTIVGISTTERYAVSAATLPAAIAIDFDDLAVPSMTMVRQQYSGVTWSQVPKGTPDARTVLWSSSWVDGNNVSHTAFWRVIEPPDAAPGCLVPPLPDAYAADDPTRNGGQLHGAAVFYADQDTVAGYDEARQLGTALFDAETYTGITRRVHVSSATSN